MSKIFSCSPFSWVDVGIDSSLDTISLMNSTTLLAKAPIRGRNKFLIEIDAERFEKLAADLGFFNPDFLQSIDRAEADYRAGRFKKLKSLKELTD